MGPKERSAAMKGISASPSAPEDNQSAEDLAIAEEAEEEYNLRGVEGTTPYTEYRDRRLESKS